MQRPQGRPRKIGRAIWIPATPEQLDLLSEEARKEFSTIGRWLLKTAMQEATRRQRRRAA
ncbi:MAG: hypothetical protein ACLGP3_02255 [Acidobacteriota bacterium]